jgi:hypothetical protein
VIKNILFNPYTNSARKKKSYLSSTEEETEAHRILLPTVLQLASKEMELELRLS